MQKNGTDTGDQQKIQEGGTDTGDQQKMQEGGTDTRYWYEYKKIVLIRKISTNTEKQYDFEKRFK